MKKTLQTVILALAAAAIGCAGGEKQAEPLSPPEATTLPAPVAPAVETIETAAPEAPAPEVSAKEVAEIIPVVLDDESINLCKELGLDPELIARLEATPLYRFQKEEVGPYLAYIQRRIPDLRHRVIHLGRKNIGQPYELYLLGEAPFETYDDQPIYCLDRSDCVVFCEHTYAMALTDNWGDFMMMLQRIRYKNGHISVATRNHYTEADWNVNNGWLVYDITAELAGDEARHFKMKIDRASLLKKRWGVEAAIPVEYREEVYIPMDMVESLAGMLQPGDFVNVMRGPSDDNVWAGHVGLVAYGPDGTLNFLHSTPPSVREEPFAEYIRRGKEAAAKAEPGKATLRGFKFLRLQDSPLEQLRDIDGSDFPIVTSPDGTRLTAANLP
jgi:hypothetical protein